MLFSARPRLRVSKLQVREEGREQGGKIDGAANARQEGRGWEARVGGGDGNEASLQSDMATAKSSVKRVCMAQVAVTRIETDVTERIAAILWEARRQVVRWEEERAHRET